MLYVLTYFSFIYVFTMMRNKDKYEQLSSLQSFHDAKLTKE